MEDRWFRLGDRGRYLARALNVDNAFAELLNTAGQIGNATVPQHQHSDTFTVGAFDLVLTKLRDGDAFALLSHACGKYSSIKADPNLLRGYLFMITDLARRTNTTERPDGLDVIVDDNPEQTKELQQWYRIGFGTN